MSSFNTDTDSVDIQQAGVCDDLRKRLAKES